MSINPNPPLKGYSELRYDLMHLADEWNKKRLELIELQRVFSEGITQLVVAADKMFTPSLKERTVDGDIRSEFKTETNVQAVADHVMPSRRNCGLCGKPGHRRDNCPNAHVVKEEKKAKVEKREVKKEREAALSTGKRACSICRKPGHRSTTCPEA